MMTKNHRIISFSLLVVLFAITAPLITFYSLGWRIDIKTGKISQPGIFYFKISPKNTQVFIDGKLKKKTDFFFGSVLIENLFPKKYEITIKKDGFYDWQKTLEIKKGEATEAKNITLIPQNPAFTSLFKKIDGIFPSPDEKKIIIKENDENGWSLKLYETDKNIKSQLVDKKSFLLKANLNPEKTTIESLDINFSNDSKIALVKIAIRENSSKLENKDNIRNIYYAIEINASSPSLSYINTKEGIKRIDINQDNKKEALILYNSNEAEKLAKIDINTGNMIAEIPEKVVDYNIFGSSIYYLDSSGIIFETDFSFNKHERINTFPIALKENAKYEITASPFAIIVKENDSLYYFNRTKDEFKKIADGINSFKFSPDYKKLAYSNNYEIWILFLDKDNSQPQKEAGEQLFLTRFSELGKVFWYTNYYLVFSAGEKIKIIETDDRDKINIVDLADFKNPEIFWSQSESKLYVLTEGTLFVSDKLIQ